MLRRRKKDQRDAKRPPRHRGGGIPQPAAVPGSRRRAREGASVPAELRIRQEANNSSPTPFSAGKDAAAKKTSPTPIILLTGFDPFGGEQLNPSWEICRELAGREVAGHRVEALKVPCEFRRSIEAVAAAVRQHRPAVVICLGQAGGRAHMSVERVAINIDDARAPDNGGARPIDEAIAPDGPAAYFATVPVKAMTAAMRKAKVPAMVSNTAGTYVCNHLMYGVLHFLAASGTATRAGFIHVPYAEAQVLDKPAVPALALASMVRGVEAALAAAVEHRHDVKVSEGTLD